MTKQESFNLIKSFFESKEISADDLDENNSYFQFQVEAETVAFNYRENEKTLTASCLIYQFHDEPKEQVLDTINDESEKETDCDIKFEPENKTLYASKTFRDQLDEKKFINNVDKIIATSKKWSSETLDHIASKVFHPEEIN